MLPAHLIRSLRHLVLLGATGLAACDDGARIVSGSDLAVDAPAGADPDGAGSPPTAPPAALDDGSSPEQKNDDPPLPADVAASGPGIDGGLAVDAGGASACTGNDLFTPRKSTLFILADRSGTMFQPLADDASPPQSIGTPWELLRSALLPLLPELEDGIRLGFAAVSGEAFSVCPDYVSVPPALENADAVASVYATLEQGPLANSGVWLALDAIALDLWSDAANAEPHLLFLNDGDADYCNDGNQLCPPDSVIAALQRLHAGLDRQGNAHPPIPTLVAGVGSLFAGSEALQAFANAGAGLPVLPVVGGAPDASGLYDQCSIDPSWSADLVAAGKSPVRGQTVADYATTSGSAPVLPPDEGALRQALRALRSCTFELSSEAPVQLDVATAGWTTGASLSLDATVIPNDAVNGWHVTSATTLAFEGTACDAWRSSATRQVQIDLPCSAFVAR